MCWKNFMIWEKKSKIPMANKNFKLAIKQFYLIVWSVEKNTESKNLEVARTKNARILILLTCSVWNSKKAIFFKEVEARGLLSSLEIKISLIKIPLFDPLLFWNIKWIK